MAPVSEVTLLSPNMGSEKPKEIPCFTEKLSTDLGCPYANGSQKVELFGKCHHFG